MADYHFNVTEAIINEGAIGMDGGGKLDAFLHDRHPGSVIDPRIAATMIDVPQRQIEAALAKYAEHGVVRADEMVECASCGTKAPADEVQGAIDEGDDYPCHGACSANLASAPTHNVVTFHLIDTPT